MRPEIPTPDQNDTHFWATVTTLVEPPWNEPTTEDSFAMDDRVHEAARALAERISTRALAYRAAGKPLDPRSWPPRPATGAAPGAVRDQAVRRPAGGERRHRRRPRRGQLRPTRGRLGRYQASVRPPQVAPRGRREVHPGIHPLHYAGGSAVVHHDADADAWWYSATAADQEEKESEAVHGTYAAAIAGATEFLLAHALPDRMRPHDPAVPGGPGDRALPTRPTGAEPRSPVPGRCRSRRRRRSGRGRPRRRSRCPAGTHRRGAGGGGRRRRPGCPPDAANGCGAASCCTG